MTCTTTQYKSIYKTYDIDNKLRLYPYLSVYKELILLKESLSGYYEFINNQNQEGIILCKDIDIECFGEEPLKCGSIYCEYCYCGEDITRFFNNMDDIILSLSYLRALLLHNLKNNTNIIQFYIWKLSNDVDAVYNTINDNFQILRNRLDMYKDFEKREKYFVSIGEEREHNDLKLSVSITDVIHCLSNIIGRMYEEEHYGIYGISTYIDVSSGYYKLSDTEKMMHDNYCKSRDNYESL